MSTAATSTSAFASVALEVAWAAFALTLIAGIGALKLLTPFDGDQALFLYFAQAIDHGEKLYVDVWDMKQPGVFWFYWLGGKIFGSSELGVKLLELGWFLTFAACLILCLRRTFAHPWMSSVAAAAALGSYYAFAGTRELTQAEILLSFPMFLSAWLLVRHYASADAASPDGAGRRLRRCRRRLQAFLCSRLRCLRAGDDFPQPRRRYRAAVAAA